MRSAFFLMAVALWLPEGSYAGQIEDECLEYGLSSCPGSCSRFICPQGEHVYRIGHKYCDNIGVCNNQATFEVNCCEDDPPTSKIAVQYLAKHRSTILSVFGSIWLIVGALKIFFPSLSLDIIHIRLDMSDEHIVTVVALYRYIVGPLFAGLGIVMIFSGLEVPIGDDPASLINPIYALSAGMCFSLCTNAILQLHGWFAPNELHDCSSRRGRVDDLYYRTRPFFANTIVTLGVAVCYALGVDWGCTFGDWTTCTATVPVFDFQSDGKYIFLAWPAFEVVRVIYMYADTDAYWNFFSYWEEFSDDGQGIMQGFAKAIVWFPTVLIAVINIGRFRKLLSPYGTGTASVPVHVPSDTALFAIGIVSALAAINMGHQLFRKGRKDEERFATHSSLFFIAVLSAQAVIFMLACDFDLI